MSHKRQGDAARMSHERQGGAARMNPQEQDCDTHMKNHHHWGFYSMFVLAVAVILVVSVFIGAAVMGLLFISGIFVPERGNPLPFLFLLVLPSVLIGVFAAAAYGRKAVRPINELSKGMQEVATGNFDVRLDEEERGQFGEVNKNFNFMATELASIEMLRDDFIVTVSHEYKSPLSSIQGYATLLQDPTLTQEERDEYLEAIMSATRSLSHMSSNILTLSNLETQTFDYSGEPYSLAEQLRQVLVILMPLISEKDLELNIELDEVEIGGNIELLETVWINLVSNAIKFTPVAGVITVKLRTSADQAYITIADSGCGMREEEIARIFDKFYQADDSRGTEGNGLGLALSKIIIERHKGSISVESKPDVGSTFTVQLPLTKELRFSGQKSSK